MTLAKRLAFLLVAFSPMTIAAGYVYWRGEAQVATMMLGAVVGLTGFCLFALRPKRGGRGGMTSG